MQILFFSEREVHVSLHGLVTAVQYTVDWNGGGEMLENVLHLLHGDFTMDCYVVDGKLSNFYKDPETTSSNDR